MNIAILDDHLLFAELLKNVLLQRLQLQEIKVFSNRGSFLQSNFQEWRPDIIVCDRIMPEIDGTDVISEVRMLLGATCKVIIASDQTNLSSVKSAMQQGAFGYVTKHEEVKELIRAIKEVIQNRRYVSKDIRIELSAS